MTFTGLASLILSYAVFDLDHYLSFAYLKLSQAHFNAVYVQYPAQVLLAYFGLYVAATALSIPAATVLTLAAGALFGLGWGSLIVSFASSMGATLAFLMARVVLRAHVQARFGHRLQELNRGLEKEGVLYLFALRLIPLLPFFLINLSMGLTTLRTWTFYWVSQLGMLAATVVYVNAGTQLAQLDSAAGILSPSLLASFTLLGVFPWLAARLLAWLKLRRVYAPWKHLKPRRFDRNLIVIGAGAGGLVSTYIAASAKAKVTLVEAHKMGGDCLNYGCVPSKTLIASARLAHQMRHGDKYGLHSTAPAFSFRAVMARVQAVIAAIEPHDSVARYQALGVEVLAGHARITSPWTVEITLANGSQLTLSTRAIVIATGARPRVPDLPGLADSGYVTSESLWRQFGQLDDVPKRIVVLGGGPVGVELAQCFARLGAEVSLVETAERLLTREDAEVSALVRASLQADGVHVLTAHQALRIDSVPVATLPHMAQNFDLGSGAAFHNSDAPSLSQFDEGAWATTLNAHLEGSPPDKHSVQTQYEKQLIVTHQGTESTLTYDALICAVGRVPRSAGLGLEELGITTLLDTGILQTNDCLQTRYPNIFAVGDVAGHYPFTHVAAHQAWYATVNALLGGIKTFKVDYRVIPWATFVDPELARVGMNEQEAQAQGLAYELSRYSLDELDRQLCDEGTQQHSHGFVKVLTVPGQDRILGVTIVGKHAADMLAEFVLAMKHGLGLKKLLATLHIYPTWSEANKGAAGQWRLAHQPERLLSWMRRFYAWQRG